MSKPSMDPEIKAAADAMVAEYRAQGVPETKIQSGLRQLATLPIEEQRQAMLLNDEPVAAPPAPPAPQSNVSQDIADAAQYEQLKARLRGRAAAPTAAPVGGLDNLGSNLTGDWNPSGKDAVVKPQAQVPVPGAGILNQLTGNLSDTVASAPDEAKKQVQDKGLSGMSMEDRLAAFMRTVPGATVEQAQQFIKVNPHWQPNSRTAAAGRTGIDPASRQEALRLNELGQDAGLEGARQGIDAESNQHRMLLEAQNNQLAAEGVFREKTQKIINRYDAERAQQNARLASIQQAMDEVGTQPRTIREWLDRSGTGKQVAYGLATALSALGGAIGRRGSQPLDSLFNRTQASIDAKVKQEQDAYKILGEKAKMNNEVYNRIRAAAQDDQAAVNITKAMYYDALGKLTEQIATQYKIDMQSPAYLGFIKKLADERAKLITDTATNLQMQESNTDKFNPGGVFAVGGGAAKKDPGPGEGQKYRDQMRAKFNDELEKRGANATADTIEHVSNVINEMKKRGYDKDKKLWAQLAIAAKAKEPAESAAILAALPDDQKILVGKLIQSTEARVKKLSGANYTANEAIRDMFKMGGFSINGLQSYSDELKREWEGTVRGVEVGYGGAAVPEGGTEIGNQYRALYDWTNISSPNVAYGGRSDVPLTPSERELRGKAKVE